MEDIKHFAERLRADIEIRCGNPVQKKLLKYGGYHIRSNRVFAWVRQVLHGRVVPDKSFPIQVKEDYAIKTGVANLADKRDDNGWYDMPACYYYVIENNIESYNRAVRALTSICRYSNQSR